MMSYENITYINSLSDLAIFTDANTGGILFTGGMIVLFIIMVMVLTRNNDDFIMSLAGSGWTFFIISSLFWLAHLIQPLVPLAFLFISGVTTLYLTASKS
jgi:hypothetical protein